MNFPNTLKSIGKISILKKGPEIFDKLSKYGKHKMHGSLLKRLQSKLSFWKHKFLIKQVFASWFYYDKLINHLYLN